MFTFFILYCTTLDQIAVVVWPYCGPRSLTIVLIFIIILQHLYSTVTPLEDTEALVVPARSVGTGGF